MSDPIRIYPRKKCMLTGESTIEMPKGRVAQRRTHLDFAVKAKKVKKRKVSANIQDDLRWVECVSMIRDGQDTAAFAELFRHFAPRVKAFLMKSGTDAAMAEECAQDVMATLWHKAHMFDATRASVATWVFTIARNRRIDMLRKQRRPEPDELTWGPEPEPDAAEVMELQQESTRLVKALSELPDKQRDLIQKAYFGDLSHSEIAAETGLPLGTIKSRIRLALERLRHSMK